MNLQCIYFFKCYELYKSLYYYIISLKIKIKTDKAYAFLVLAVENSHNVVCLLGFLITYVNIFNSKLYLFFSMYCFYFEFNFVCIQNSCFTVKKNYNCIFFIISYISLTFNVISQHIDCYVKFSYY